MTTRNQPKLIPREITPEFLDALRAHGAVRAYVFGSRTRGEERADSDLNLLATFDPPITLFQRMDVADALSRLCGRRVDLLTTIHPAFVPFIRAHAGSTARMTKSAQPHLELIRESLSQIDRHRPSTRDAFLAQPMVQDAVLMRLHVMGESLACIRRLDADAFEKVAHHSWYKLIGLRNNISHGYEIIDFDEIWQIITEELPRFSESIAAASEKSAVSWVSQNSASSSMFLNEGMRP